MSLLVDTHVMIWEMTGSDRVSARAHEVLADMDAAVHVSAATAWEIATKARIGKLPGGDLLVRDFERNLRDWYAFSVPIEAQDALLAGTLQWDHRDPFDRMIAAQALRRRWPLVSADRAFDDVPGLVRIW